MNQKNSSLQIKRILVPLDASRHSLAALESAIELAAGLRAELEGLFVEDENLLRLSDFPFAREVNLFSVSPRKLSREELERHVRIQARQVREALERSAKGANVKWKFRVTRGGVTSEVVAQSREADLTVLGKIGRSFPTGKRIGSTVREIVARGQGLTMILPQRIRMQGPIYLVYTGSELSRKALDTSLYLISDKKIPLRLVIYCRDKDEYESLKKEVSQILEKSSVKTDFFPATGMSCARLVWVLSTEEVGLVILPCGEPNMVEEELQKIIYSSPIPILLVR